MVVNNIVYSSQCPRIDGGNIVYTDGIRNIVHPHLCYGTGGGGLLQCGKQFHNIDIRPVPEHCFITN